MEGNSYQSGQPSLIISNLFLGCYIMIHMLKKRWKILVTKITRMDQAPAIVTFTWTHTHIYQSELSNDSCFPI